MANYVLRRDGRDYQAPDLETLRQWASDGRVLPADMVFSPRYQSWYRARDLRELRDVLPLAEQSTPPPVARPPQQFWVRKGDRNYVADSLQTVLEWASNGNIGPDDLIYHPSYGKWFRAGDSPQLAGRFPPHIMGARMPFIAPGDDPLAGADFGLDPGRAAEQPRNRPMTSPVGNPAHRRSVVPRQRSRTGPVLIGSRKGARGTRSGPFAMGQPTAESADSTKATVTDFSVGDVARAIQARRESGAVSLSSARRAENRRNPGQANDDTPTAVNPAVSPAPKTSIGDWGARDEQVFSAADAVAADGKATIETALPTIGREIAPATTDPSAPAADKESDASDAPAAQSSEAPAAKSGEKPTDTQRLPEDDALDADPDDSDEAPAAEDAPAAADGASPASDEAPADVAGDDEPALDPIYAEPIDADPNARFVDRLKMFKPFYAVAKVFLVTKDMRPGERLEPDAKVPGYTFQGREKREIYMDLRRYLVEELNGSIKKNRALVADEHEAGFEAFLAAALHLVGVFGRCGPIVGTKPPERFVVGNVGRPKMSPAEEALIAELDSAFKSLFAVKSKSAAA